MIVQGQQPDNINNLKSKTPYCVGKNGPPKIKKPMNSEKRYSRPNTA